MDSTKRKSAKRGPYTAIGNFVGKAFFLFCSLALPLCAHAMSLGDCGRVVGHEMGLWDFFSFNPSPDQVDRVVGSSLRFVKVSLQPLKDGIWVVSHDDSVTIYPTYNNDDAFEVKFKDLTWAEVEQYRQDPDAYVPVYRLDDYVNRDQGKLCWMFSPKAPPSESLVRQIERLGIADRSVILTGGIQDVRFLAGFPDSLGLHYAGRVSEDASALEDYKPYLQQLWAMEIDPKPKAPEMVKAVHALGLKAYIDSMRYSWNYEFFGTECDTVFAMGADYTQTNRPIQCLHLGY